MGFFDFLTEEIAIDLGTANTHIIHNDKVVVDSPSIVARDRISGKIIAVGSQNEIESKYQSIDIINAEGNTIVPGLIDAHCHFLGLGFNQQAVDLFDTKSFEGVIKRVLDFQNERKNKFILGRGWDQNDWQDKIFPNKKLLDKLYPNTPIALTRIDGHAILCNQAALDLGKVTVDSKIKGG